VRIASRAPGPRDTDHELIWTAVAVASGVVAWIASAWGVPVTVPACVFKAITGWPCLTCGGTRALRALAGLDVAAAWRLNPLVTAVAAAWSAYAVYGAGAIVGAWPRLKVELDSREGLAMRVGAIACAMATWVFLVVDGR
jgi:hypothetical protein